MNLQCSILIHFIVVARYENTHGFRLFRMVSKTSKTSKHIETLTIQPPPHAKQITCKYDWQVGWIMFLLVQIYYSGALTMFFTSETPLPFETTKEVIRSHPDWKMVYQVRYNIQVFLT